MQADYTHITAILDSSGSMSTIRESTINGFNTFLKGQKEAPGKATFTQIHFSSGMQHQVRDAETANLIGGTLIAQPPMFGGVLNKVKSVLVPPYHVVDNHADIKDVKELAEETYVPYGNTPLLDTIGRALIETGEWLASLSEDDRPSKVLFVIVTDGEERDSRKYTYKQISEMISHQTEVYNWTFMFLGANQDAIAVGSQLGIKRDLSATYGLTPTAVDSTYTLMSNKVALLRSAASAQAGATAMAYSDEERVEALTGVKTPPTV